MVSENGRRPIGRRRPPFSPHHLNPSVLVPYPSLLPIALAALRYLAFGLLSFWEFDAPTPLRTGSGGASALSSVIAVESRGAGAGAATDQYMGAPVGEVYELLPPQTC